MIGNRDVDHYYSPVDELIDTAFNIWAHYEYDADEEAYECQHCDEFFNVTDWERAMWSFCPICGLRIKWHDEGGPFDGFEKDSEKEGE